VSGASTSGPIDGGGKLEARVDRLYWITDDHGKRIAKLEDSGLITFMTEMRINFGNLSRKVSRMDDKIDDTKKVVDAIATSEAGEDAVNRHKGDMITRVVMPLIAAGGVLAAILALVIR
jgi:hypothetical protein